jgi:hypothetical protein
MSLPVVDRIARVIESRIDGVTIANGYSQTLVAARQTKAGEVTPADGTVIIVQMDASDEPLLENGNPPMVTWRQQFAINIYVRPSDADSTPIDALVNLAVSDVIRAVCTPAAWYQFADSDGYTAINAEWGSKQNFNAENGTLEGATLPLTVEYRTSETDPTEVR